MTLIYIGVVVEGVLQVLYYVNLLNTCGWNHSNRLEKEGKHSFISGYSSNIDTFPETNSEFTAENHGLEDESSFPMAYFQV